MDVSRLSNRAELMGMDATPNLPTYRTIEPGHLGLPDHVRELLEETRQLREQVEHLKAEVAKMERVEREVMQLIKAPTREKIIHDLRNVLNELVLLQAIAGQDD